MACRGSALYLGFNQGKFAHLGSTRGQTEFQYAWVRIAPWCWARCQVQYLAPMVLGLTWPREAGTFVLFPDVRKNPKWDTHFFSSKRCPFKENNKTKPTSGLKFNTKKCDTSQKIHVDIYQIRLESLEVHFPLYLKQDWKTLVPECELLVLWM